MKSTLKMFGATLHQTCSALAEKIGVHSIKEEAVSVSSAISVASASEKSSASDSSGVLTFGRAMQVFGEAGKLKATMRVFGFALAATAALAAPAMAQQAYIVDGQQHTVSSDGTRYDKDGRSENNTTARVAGGLIGAIAGNALASDANALWKGVITATGAYVGQSVGDAATRRAVDQNGNPIERTVDERGRVIYKPIVSRDSVGRMNVVNPLLPRPGDRIPSSITTETFNEALRIASGYGSAQPGVGSNGQQWRALDSDVHNGIYTMMVDAVAHRQIAKLAVNDLNAAEVAMAVSQNPATKYQKAADYTAANKAYIQAFQAYATSYQQVNSAINIAERNGFDVTAQRVLMATVPSDLKFDMPMVSSWPRVDDRVREIAVNVSQDRSLSLGEISSLAQAPQVKEKIQQMQRNATERGNYQYSYRQR